MKSIFAFLFLSLTFNCQSQSNDYKLKLGQLAAKRVYWSNETDKDIKNEIASDSLDYYNIAFEKYLLQIANSNPESISTSFPNLEKNYIRVLTSADGNFRIYNWDTFTGGTMRFFKNILQYKVDEKVHALLFINSIDEGDDEDYNPGCSFYELNQVNSGNKHFYITCSVAIGSSAVYYYEAKVFSIDNGKLNQEAKLIKTKSGIRNTVGYEIDLSNEANRSNTYFEDRKLEVRDYITMEYDKKTNTLQFPLLDENERVTVKKIKYQFTGTYFEKIVPKKKN